MSRTELLITRFGHRNYHALYEVEKPTNGYTVYHVVAQFTTEEYARRFAEMFGIQFVETA